MKIEKFAAIDIGSNAIRLLISNVIIKKGFPIKFIKSSIVRVPIRPVSYTHLTLPTIVGV